jgi:tetratricopeptide (TPR) repeat protein
VIEQVVIPTSADVTAVPAVRFAFFDPAAGRYRTVTRGPFPLTVRARVGATAASTAASHAGGQPDDVAADAEKLGRDIIYVKDAPGAMRRGRPFYSSPVFLSLQLLPLGVYVLGIVVARRRERLRGDPRYARFARAGREARKAIAAARRDRDRGEMSAVYDALAHAVREYLSAKLDLPPGGVNAERVAERLGRSDGNVVDRIGEFFGLVEQVRYAPSADGGQHQRAIDLAEAIVRDLEKQRRLGGRFERRLAAAALLMVVGAPCVIASEQGAAFDPMTSFFESNTLYKAGRYREAAAGYRAIVDAGVRSGALYYNLGNARLKAGEIGRAILNYERARRLLPRDPDVRANLKFAREQMDAKAPAAPAPPLWLRLSVPLAFRATTGELAVATLLAYWALMLLLTLRLFFAPARQTLGRGAAAVALVLVVVGSAAAVRVMEEHVRTTAVVVEPGEVAVRFEPSSNGTVHFSLPEGAVVRNLAERDGWYEVARGDGRRGWIDAAAVEQL